MEAFATLLHVPTGTTLEQGALGGATHDPLHATPRRFVRPMVSVLPTVVRYSIRMCSVRCENQYMMCAVRWSSHVQEWDLPWPYVIPAVCAGKRCHRTDRSRGSAVCTPRRPRRGLAWFLGGAANSYPCVECRNSQSASPRRIEGWRGGKTLRRIRPACGFCCPWPRHGVLGKAWRAAA